MSMRVILVSLGLGACSTTGANMCPLPAPEAETGSLTIEHLHEFGRSYEIFDVSYKVDDCMLLRATDTALLRKDSVDLGTHVVLAGQHELVQTVQFRSDFIAGGTGYVWAGRHITNLDVPPGGRLKLTARYFEEPGADPRTRMRTEIRVEDQAQSAGVASAPSGE